MLFNSITFLFFFPIVITLYFLLNHKYRWALLLVSSYYFYMCWKPEYIVLILASTLIDYFSALHIQKSNTPVVRKTLLTLSLCSNLGMLFFFKYFNFFSQSVNEIFNQFNVFNAIPAYQILLPVGISFYTFQTMSYTIDVYNKNIEPEKHFGRFALFVAFWPQLVAGPIERAKSLLPQLKKKISFTYYNTVYGLRLMLWGFFKKVVVADRLSAVVDQVYNAPSEQPAINVIIGTVFFAFQIYCDFSGYSDIAIGCAKIMGIDLITNFKRPYFSKNLAIFWNRWHISLSTWFKDYVYIPLGGNRVIKWRFYYNLLVTFLISGVWHGANWTFIIWGAIHGVFIVLFYVFNKKQMEHSNTISGKLKEAVGIALTFFIVCCSWVFFRANSVHDAVTLFENIYTMPFQIANNMLFTLPEFETGLIFIGLLLFLDVMQHRYEDFAAMLDKKSSTVRWSVYYVLILSILLFGYYNNNTFIYFQF